MLPYQQERFLSVPPSTACSPQRPHVHLQPLPAGPSHLAQHPKVQGRSTWELFQDPQTQRGCVDARQRITHTSWEALRSPNTTETFCRVGFMTNKIFMSALRSLANWQVFIWVCTDIGRAHSDRVETHSDSKKAKYKCFSSTRLNRAAGSRNKSGTIPLRHGELAHAHSQVQNT